MGDGIRCHPASGWIIKDRGLEARCKQIYHMLDNISILND